MQQLTELKTRLRAGVDVGKWRARALKLGYERSTHTRERRQAIAALGTLAWEQRIEHPDYAELFAQLRDLEQQRNATQAHIATLETTIQQEETRKRRLPAEFSDRQREAEQPDHAAPLHTQPAEEQPVTETLTQPPPEVTRQSAHPDSPYATKRLDITDIPATAATEPAVPAPGDMQTIQAEQQQSPARADDMLADLRQEMQRKRNRLADLERQFPALQQSLGEAVNRVRPQHDSLVEHYARLDTLDQELARRTDELDTLNQQIASAGTGATKTLYWLAGGAAVALVALLLLVSNGLSISGGGGGVSERQIRADLVGQTIYWNDGPGFFDGSDTLGWNLQSNQIRTFDIVRRKTNLEAGTDDLVVHLILDDGIMRVSSDLELSYHQYEQGWVLDDGPYAENELRLIEARNTPDKNRIEQEIRDAHDDRINADSWCFESRLQRISIAGSYGGTEAGTPKLIYEVETYYDSPPAARPGQLQEPDMCYSPRSWYVFYTWNGSNWRLNRAIG